ncbi:hypothetical protein PHET_05372 [Paragonimus heterotremus]|uniref:Uncharacterized protein n=1 Tax=Paragonimus heterotremus TaxID=100268 RepID=A0A8J4X017_9TREM|nr:hypothetical protein PHET_05372 [Paragonimus heterotremus]
MITETDRSSTNSDAPEVEDYLKGFDILCLTKSVLDEKGKVAFFLHFISMEAYALVKNLAFPGPPIISSCPAPREILFKHFKPVQFLAVERATFIVLIRSESQLIRDFDLQLQTQPPNSKYNIQLEAQLCD